MEKMDLLKGHRQVWLNQATNQVLLASSLGPPRCDPNPASVCRGVLMRRWGRQEGGRYFRSFRCILMILSSFITKCLSNWLPLPSFMVGSTKAESVCSFGALYSQHIAECLAHNRRSVNAADPSRKSAFEWSLYDKGHQVG